MKYQGDFALGTTVYLEFTTNNGSGGSVEPSDPFELADLNIYKNHAAFSPSGMALTSTFDGSVGLHTLTIDTSDNGDDDWEINADYFVSLDPDETVDGESVVAVIGSFSIENRYMRGTDSAALDATVAKTGADGDTLETLSDQIDGLTLTGARAITIQLYETATTTPIADVAISVYNSDQTLFLGKKTTDSNGQIVIGRDDGTYKLVSVKAGTTFTVPETLTVTEDDTKTYYGDSIVIAPPSDPDACRVYDYLYLPGSSDKPTTVVAKALIKKLPYDRDGKLHSGDEITEVYDANTGLIYWDIVRGATVLFEVDDFIKVTKTVPDLDTARLVEI